MSTGPCKHRLGLIRDTRGLSTVEYVIILAVIASIAVASWREFGEKVHAYLLDATDEIDASMP